MKRIATSTIIVLGLGLGACEEGEDFENEWDERSVLFDAVEINRRLEEDPTNRFLVDISDGTVNYFDETLEDIDFSNFLFYCPSMPAPLPIASVAPGLLNNRPQTWSVELVGSDTVDFRSGACVTICQNGSDCYQRCPTPLPERPRIPPPPPSPF